MTETPLAHGVEQAARALRRAFEGVEDAVKAAARISAMDRTRLHVAVIDAGREPYGNLPFTLADRPGDSVVEGRTARGRVPDREGGTVER